MLHFHREWEFKKKNGKIFGRKGYQKAGLQSQTAASFTRCAAVELTFTHFDTMKMIVAPSP